LVYGKRRGEHRTTVKYVTRASGTRQQAGSKKRGEGERLPDMGVEEGAFASGPVLRGGGATNFFCCA